MPLNHVLFYGNICLIVLTAFYLLHFQLKDDINYQEFSINKYLYIYTCPAIDTELDDTTDPGLLWEWE